MVVDRDDRVADGPRLRVGQQRLGARDDRHPRSSIWVTHCEPGYPARRRSLRQHGSQRGAVQVTPTSEGGSGANTNRETSPVPLFAPPTKGPLVRRLGATLAIVAVALVGSTTFASAATVPLTKVAVSGGADEKPSVKFPKPFAADRQHAPRGQRGKRRQARQGQPDPLRLPRGRRPHRRRARLVVRRDTGRDRARRQADRQGPGQRPRRRVGREPRAHRARPRKRDWRRTRRATARRT